MAFCNKAGSLIRKSILASNALSGQSSMLNAIRSYATRRAPCSGGGFKEKRALRQFTVSKGKSAGRNSSGCITSFHRGGGAKRLQRTIDLKRSTSSMGIVERIEYDPNRSTRIALVRWKGVAHQGRRKAEEEVAPTKKRLESTTTTIHGPFAFSSLPGDVVQKNNCTKELFLSAFTRKGEAASHSFGSLGFPRIAVAGAKAPFFAFRMRESGEVKNTFSLGEIQKWRASSSFWAHRIKRKAAVSWHSGGFGKK